MRLGFDLDNVLANLIDPLNDYLNERFDMVFVRETWHTRIIEDLKLDLEEELEKQVRRAAYNAVFDMDFLNDLPPVEGAKGVINFLRKKGHEIYVITSRKSEAFDMSSDWLKKHGIYFDALICTKYKPREAWSLGVRTFVDDDFDILLDFANFRRAKFFKKLVVMDYPYNNERHDKRIERVKNLHEVLSKLEIKGKNVCDL